MEHFEVRVKHGMTIASCQKFAIDQERRTPRTFGLRINWKSSPAFEDVHMFAADMPEANIVPPKAFRGHFIKTTTSLAMPVWTRSTGRRLGTAPPFTSREMRPLEEVSHRRCRHCWRDTSGLIFTESGAGQWSAGFTGKGDQFRALDQRCQATNAKRSDRQTEPA